MDLSLRLRGYPSRVLLNEISGQTRGFTNTAKRRGGEQTASAKLFEDAAREEAEGTQVPKKSAHLTFLENQRENWTGDERIEDTVLRMLVDKYRPLRIGKVQTAEDKLQRSPPKVAPHSTPSTPMAGATTIAHVHGSSAEQPLLPATEGHKPWHTVFKAPSHASPSVRPAQFADAPIRTRLDNDNPRVQEIQSRKRVQEAGRLSKARESTLDYRLGIGRPRNKESHPSKLNPVTMKGWGSLTEERIEKARATGHFNSVRGRGKPIMRVADETNPFIAREEFLMNRIVQRNGAVPPWIELQCELETSVSTFREILRQSWIRRVVRNLTMSSPTPSMYHLTVTQLATLRDKEWEDRERSYHETAIDEINSLVRKYNGLAPYPVRRPYYTRSGELEKVYEECGEHILQALAERAQSLGTGHCNWVTVDRTIHTNGTELDPDVRLRDVFRRWLKAVAVMLGWRIS